METFVAYLANSKKAVVQFLTAALSLLTFISTANVLPKADAAFCASAVIFLGTVLHYFTTNSDAPGEAPAQEELDSTASDYDEDETPDEDTVPDGPVTATQAGAVDVPADSVTT